MQRGKDTFGLNKEALVAVRLDNDKHELRDSLRSIQAVPQFNASLASAMIFLKR